MSNVSIYPGDDQEERVIQFTLEMIEKEQYFNTILKSFTRLTYICTYNIYWLIKD